MGVRPGNALENQTFLLQAELLNTALT